MIGYIKGTIQSISEIEGVLVSSGGIGYWVLLPDIHMHGLRVGEHTELFIYHHITDVSQGLFGFHSLAERDSFKLMLKINGIGPKTALALLCAGDNQARYNAVISGDLSFFTAVSGIGKKTAERIMVELRNIYEVEVPFEAVSTAHTAEVAPLVEALIQLGYQSQDIVPVVNEMPVDLTDISDQIKYALSQLA